MKKLVAIIVVLVLVMSCTVAFAVESKATTGEKKGFWREFADLFQKQIPDTFNQKSQTHTVWTQTPGRGHTGK